MHDTIATNGSWLVIVSDTLSSYPGLPVFGKLYNMGKPECLPNALPLF